MQPSQPSQGPNRPAPPNEQPGSSGQGAGPAGGGQPDHRPTAAGPWGPLPDTFCPMLGAFNPFILNEHDWAISSLLSAAPDRVLLPPIPIVALPRDDLLIILREICIQLLAYSLLSRTVILTFTDPASSTLDHLFLALTVFRQPSNIDGAVAHLIELVMLMVKRFREWAASWGAAIPVGPCEYPELIAAGLKAQANKVLMQQFPLTDESKWLLAAVRALGDIPEFWGFPGSLVARLSAAAQMSNPASQQAQGVPPQQQVAPILMTPSSSNTNLPTATGASAQPAALGHTAGSVQPNPSFVPQGADDGATDVGQNREANASRHSVASSNTPRSKAQAQLASSRLRVSRLSDIVRHERERIVSMDIERDIAQGLASVFYRGLFTLYSHNFTGSRLCLAYHQAILRVPNAMFPLVVRFCEHMQRDVDILMELGRA